MVDSVVYNRGVKYHIIRLHPKEDLKLSIERYVEKNNILAGSILTCVGSLAKISLRLPDLSKLEEDGSYEIVSLVGNVGVNRTHLHLSVGNKEGSCYGGHLLENNYVYTTAEIIIIEFCELKFIGEEDKETGFKELKIIENNNSYNDKNKNDNENKNIK